jgi:hypothetical protein
MGAMMRPNYSNGGNPMKRLILPLLASAVLFVSAHLTAQAQAGAATNERVLVKAQGHPMLHAFEVMSNKRADLRLARATKPLDVAFTEWLQSDRPSVYRQYEAEFYAKRGGKPEQKRTAKSSRKPSKAKDIARK